MSTKQNKKIYREFLEAVFNRHEMEALDRYLTEDFVRHGISGHDDISGRETYKRWAAEFLAAFPDCHNETLDLVAEGTGSCRGIASPARTARHIVGWRPQGEPSQ